MAQTCSRCARVNPAEAVYCYFDGNTLDGHARIAGQLPPGMQPFPTALVYATGQSCRNFNELARAAQSHWEVMSQMLREGVLENFLSGLGRLDLAAAAQEAARVPDPDFGLDQFLARLPGQSAEGPRLHVKPPHLDLGPLRVGEDRRIDVNVSNLGRRLLYGSVNSECEWLCLGDVQAAKQ